MSSDMQKEGQGDEKNDGMPSIYCLTWMLTLTTVTCDCAAFVSGQISSHVLFDSNVSKPNVLQL